MVVAWLAGLHFWWPKMTGRMYSDFWSRLAAVIVIIGFFLTFLPQFILGYHGMPRRYPNYAPEFQMLNIMSTAGASIQGVGYADAGLLPDRVAVQRPAGRGRTRGGRPGWSGRRPARRRRTTSTRLRWCTSPRTSTHCRMGWGCWRSRGWSTRRTGTRPTLTRGCRPVAASTRPRRAAPSPTTSTTSASSSPPSGSGCGSSWSPRCCSSRGRSSPTPRTASGSRGSSRPAAPSSTSGSPSINTFLLLTSSLTITLGIRACYVGDQAGLRRWLLATIVLGSAFLGLKAREYHLDYEEGLIPSAADDPGAAAGVQPGVAGVPGGAGVRRRLPHGGRSTPTTTWRG